MIGKVALTKYKGLAFVITDNITVQHDVVPKYEGFLLVPSRFGEAVTETEPRILGDLNDLIDFEKLSHATIQLINKEAEKVDTVNEVQKLKSVDENLDKGIESTDTLSTSL